ncbi:lytic transglycosylase domain-containing protein [Agromyces sp. MMS24-K17]|uniref:aggregation-promoting factor C-terminal-like domain-containing protein n=1 Tax=Agromyces sp. MMS24-K17 TaxID=3372850 RepID=UPI0037548D9B
MGRHTGAEADGTPEVRLRSTWSPTVQPDVPARATARRAAAGRGVVTPAKQALTVVFATLAAFGLVVVNLVDPAALAAAPEHAAADRFGGEQAQGVTASGAYDLSVARESYVAKEKPKTTSTTAASGWAPPAVTPDPGSAQAYAAGAVAARGWPSTEFDCLVALWAKESGWRVNAYNAGSGAYGIPQALPGSKMASAGADWETNAATQIEWGLGYVSGRYGTPCGAWAHSQSSGWY